MSLPDPERPLMIGTRGSPLALAQAEETRDRLAACHDLPTEAFRIEVIRTSGDRVQDRPLSEIGGKGLFTKEIEEALLAGRIDIAVHSMKDMPTVLPDGLGLTCVLPRADVRDAFVSLHHDGLDDLPRGAVFGTSSLRRRAQLLHRRPDLRMVEFRGNVQTRLSKLGAGVADATLLAAAGMMRMGRLDLAAGAIAPDVLLPAIAQGAIGIEQRLDDDRTSALLAPINDVATATQLAAERRFLAGLDGSCQTPIAGLAELDGDRLHFRGEIIRPDGSERIETARIGHAGEAADLGADAAVELRRRGGAGFFDH